MSEMTDERLEEIRENHVYKDGNAKPGDPWREDDEVALLISELRRERAVVAGIRKSLEEDRVTGPGELARRSSLLNRFWPGWDLLPPPEGGPFELLERDHKAIHEERDQLLVLLRHAATTTLVPPGRHGDPVCAQCQEIVRRIK